MQGLARGGYPSPCSRAAQALDSLCCAVVAEATVAVAPAVHAIEGQWHLMLTAYVRSEQHVPGAETGCWSIGRASGRWQPTVAGIRHLQTYSGRGCCPRGRIFLCRIHRCYPQGMNRLLDFARVSPIPYTTSRFYPASQDPPGKPITFRHGYNRHPRNK